MSAYLEFCKLTRKEIISENKDLTFAEVGAELGKRWRALSDEQKEKYVKLSAKSKKLSTGTKTKTSGKTAAKTKTAARTYRPLSPYMNFCKLARKEIVKENPDYTFGEIGAELGSRWKQMTIEEKSKYE